MLKKKSVELTKMVDRILQDAIGVYERSAFQSSKAESVLSL